MDSLRHAWRSLVRAPGFAAGATATFALGIGINVAVFSSVDRLLFRPLPYRDADRLFLIQQIDLDSGQRVPLPTRYVVEARALGLIEDLAILGDSTGFFMTPAHEGAEVRVSMVTSRMLAVGGVRPIIGRDFSDEDDRVNRQVAILTHEGWRARFGGDRNVLGQRIWFRDRALEIIGVLPPGYIPPGTFIDPDISGIARMATPTFAVDAVQRTHPPTVRLKVGVTREAAQAAIDGIVARLAPELPAATRPQAVRLVPIREAMFGQYNQYVWLVIAGASLVLLVACANLAGLFLVRGRARLKDAAVRLTLGASRRRLVADALAEGAIVSVAGATGALLALRLGSDTLAAVVPPIFARFAAGPDGRVVAFAIAVALAASLIAAALPSLLVTRGDVWRVAQGGAGPLGGGSPRRGRWILAVEAAIGVVLVAGAAMTARNLADLTSARLGFEPRDLHLILITSTATRAADRYADLDQALGAVRAQPGVAFAAGAPRLSVLRTGTAPFSTAGPPCCRWHVTGDYLATVGAPLVAGRAISHDDVRTQARVAMLNQAALARVWPGVPPAAAVGRMLALEGEPAREVIGVTGDTRQAHDAEILPGLFVPIESDPFSGMLILARVRPGGGLPYAAVRTAVEAPDRRTLIYVRPMAPAAARVLVAPRFRAMLFGAFAAVSLVVAMVGLYALTSFEVASRRRELGVRMALGASRRALVRLVVADSGAPVIVGVAAGIGLVFWAAPFLQSFLHRAEARDPLALAAAAVAMLAASVLAALIPALRAARVDPAGILKT